MFGALQVTNVDKFTVRFQKSDSLIKAKTWEISSPPS